MTKMDLPWLFCWTIGGCSAILTGIFGATFGGDSWFLMGLFFFVNVLLSALCPITVAMCTTLMLNGRLVSAGVLAIFVPLFIGWDLVTNAGTSALFRQNDLVRADNQNTNAQNARSEVNRLQSRIAEIRAKTAWKTDYLAPAAYDAIIAKHQAATENGQNIWQRSGECRNATVGSSQTTCQAIREAQANKQNALERQALKSELIELESELKDAKLAVAETPTQASASLAHAANISAGLTGQINPGEESTFWANYGLSVAGGAIVTIGNIAASILLAFSRSTFAESKIREPSWDRNPLPPPANVSAPQPLIPVEPVDHSDRSMEMFAELLEKINSRHQPTPDVIPLRRKATK